jgi:hypothetical protein
MLLWPFRDLPANHAAFVAINRLAARHALPLERRVVDFRPDTIADDGWRREVVRRSFPDLAEENRPEPPTDTMTRGKFAKVWWQAIRGLPMKSRKVPTLEWPEETTGARGPESDGLCRQEPGGRAFNFTGKGSAPITGFTNDHGLPYDEGTGHGWLRDISGHHRRRRALPEAHRDTFLFTRTTDTWECAVPNGRWTVTVCVGDSGHEQPGQFVWLEDRPLVVDVFTESGVFHEATTTVEVTDGRLSVRIGRGEAGSNTCLNWILIRQESRSPEGNR